jgi:alpha-amylase/alpha-mannosidase (GH57 family)
MTMADRTNRIAPILLLAAAFLLIVAGCKPTPPFGEKGRVVFTLSAPDTSEVFVAGDFTGWQNDPIPMTRNEESQFTATTFVQIGFHQYRFIVDGEWITDPSNDAVVINNYGEENSAFYFNAKGEVELRAPEANAMKAIDEPATQGTVYLSLVWHQHQPFYLDAEKDQLIAPWVRTHITKDYYDMTAMVAEYPDIHVAVNLTPVLLTQIQSYYVQRLAPYYDRQTNRIRSGEFLDRWVGRTDPWVDLMLRDTESFSTEDEGYLFRNEWSAFSVSSVMMERFPQYLALRNKPRAQLTVQDKRNIKCWFWLALFDPDFLRGEVRLVTGRTVDLSDLIFEKDGPQWESWRDFTEDDANRLVAEMVKIAEATVPLHRQMSYDPLKGTGQVELTTTPFFHPILPLLIDVQAGRSSKDKAPASLRFNHPEDARMHIYLAQAGHEAWFGQKPKGFWPAEGSVSQTAINLFAEEKVTWIATGDGVLQRSEPSGLAADTPYRVMGAHNRPVVIFFRNTGLSDLIGFRYQRWDPEEAAEDFVRQILTLAPAEAGQSNHITVLLDGENAWEWYTEDPDAKQFLHALYRKLSERQDAGRIVTVTPMEYLHGNPGRGVPSHDPMTLPEITSLWPGSWIFADFSTWIGEDEENRAWRWLARVRSDLEKTAGRYHPLPIKATDRDRAVNAAWRSLFAAEGSDWFWWYGADQNTGEGDTRWDMLYRTHLLQVYRNLQKAGYEIEVPKIPSLMDEGSDTQQGGGTMTPGQ